MARLTPAFSASRAVAEYTEQHYLPSSAAYRARAANQGALARNLVEWRSALESKWASIGFGAVTVEAKAEQNIIGVVIFLKDINPNSVRVELYADGLPGGDAMRQEMARVAPLAHETGSFAYSATVSSARPAADYTARIMPRFDDLKVPLEASWIKWQE